MLRSEGKLGDVLSAAVPVDHDDIVLPDNHISSLRMFV